MDKAQALEQLQRALESTKEIQQRDDVLDVKSPAHVGWQHSMNVVLEQVFGKGHRNVVAFDRIGFSIGGSLSLSETEERERTKQGMQRGYATAEELLALMIREIETSLEDPK